MVIYIMYYTAHHLGQVFVPYVVAGGTGMMLSCYLFHVETNIEQVFLWTPISFLSIVFLALGVPAVTRTDTSDLACMYT